MKSQGYNSMMFTLRNAAGEEVKLHDILVLESRGASVAERSAVLYGEAPHKQGSSGYVTTTAGRFYAHVYGLRWVPDNERTTTINIDALAAVLVDYCQADHAKLAQKTQRLHLSYEFEQELQQKISNLLI